MAELNGDWMVVRDGVRMSILEHADPWDRLTLLASLSSDPRSWEELAIAWSRFRPTEPLRQMSWKEITELPEFDASRDVVCWIDMAATQYALIGDPETSLAAGRYQSAHTQPARHVWLNIPPWWQRVAIQYGVVVPYHPEMSEETLYSPTSGSAADQAHVDPQYAANANSDQARVLQAGESNDQRDDASSDVWPNDSARLPSGFREVLYGDELIAFVADRSIEVSQSLITRQVASGQLRPKRKRKRSISRQRLQERRGRLDSNRARDAIRQMHVQWLMTPRASLNGWTPRECLHIGRQWKDRELDFRRAQWSMSRSQPPAVPESAYLAIDGPMGIEEVVTYFDLCRDLFRFGMRYRFNEPQQPRDQLIANLRSCKQLILDGPASGTDVSLQSIIMNERQLIPQLAGNDPIDCDCPLCRMQSAQSDLFGPAFAMSDGWQLEMEGEFAFSLCADLEEWELMRDTWPSEDASTRSANSGEFSSVSSDDTSNVQDGEESVWRSSFVTPSPDPRLSLFSIGARLGELIELLKSNDAAPDRIDRLNERFDALSSVIGKWLIAEATADGVQPSQIEEAAQRMNSELESVAIAYPGLTGQSADLQSLVNDWQRQLLTPGA